MLSQTWVNLPLMPYLLTANIVSESRLRTSVQLTAEVLSPEPSTELTFSGLEDFNSIRFMAVVCICLLYTSDAADE